MRDDSTAAVAARGVHVRLGTVQALDGLDLTAPARAITAVLGPNGAGKTTFVRTVATLQRYDGSLTVTGRQVSSHPAAVRRTIGLAGQHAAVVGQLTGCENLALVARLYGQDARTAAASAQHVVEILDLGEFADRRADTYSGGQRRRLDLGVSLVGKPSLLLLDEPTTGLDLRSRDALWELVRALPATGTSVLLTTQNLDEAAALADHVAIIDHGRLVTSGSPSQLRRATATTSVTLVTERPLPATVVGDLAASLDAEPQHDGATVCLVGRFTLDAAYDAIRAAGLSDGVSELSFQPPTLDDVFLALTGPEREVAA